MFVIENFELRDLCESFVDFWDGIRFRVPGQFEQHEPAFRAIEVNDRYGLQHAIREGTLINAQNSDGETLLACAARYGRPAIIASLLKVGADVAAVDSRGRTALVHAACDRHSVQCMQLLLEAGADPDTRLEDGSTLLMTLMKRYHFARPRHLLLDFGCEIEATNELGETPLSCCAWIDVGNDDETIDRVIGKGPAQGPAIEIWRRIMFAESPCEFRRLAEYRAEDVAPESQRSSRKRIDGWKKDHYVERLCDILARLRRVDILEEFAKSANAVHTIQHLAFLAPEAVETSRMLTRLVTSSRDSIVRETAARNLKRLKPSSEILAVLHRALKDPDVNVRDAAQSTLIQLDEPR
jgi:hypothetical protein